MTYLPVMEYAYIGDIQLELNPCQNWTEIRKLFMLALDRGMAEVITESGYIVKTLRKFCVNETQATRRSAARVGGSRRTGSTTCSTAAF